MAQPTDPTVAPNRLPWPPILYGGWLLAGILLELAVPSDVPLPRWSGWIVVFVGIAFDGAAILAMRRARTNILPHRGADRLLTTGPFSISRNPIYVGNTLLVCGLGVAFDSLWIVGAAFVAATLTHHLAILREEAHLEARFGEAFRAYRATVPRWIGRVSFGRR